MVGTHMISMFGPVLSIGKYERLEKHAIDSLLCFNVS